MGGGPAGLMAAEVLAAAGLSVDVYDAMPTVGRKFLLAGKGGLNLTHSEPLPALLARYGSRRAQLEPLLTAFGPDELRAWAAGLGVESIVGSSGRVFPASMAAAPLLRAWLTRLRRAGVRLHMRHRWLGWLGDAPGSTRDGEQDARTVVARGEHGLRFSTPRGETTVRAPLVLLALGGGSWRKLGSDGAWAPLLQQCGVDVAPLRPSNCGFDVGWSEHFRGRFAGHAVKTVALSIPADGEGSGEGGGDDADRDDAHVAPFQQAGEFVITETGVEGGVIYAASARLRDTIAARGAARLHVDLAPGRSLQTLAEQAARPRGSRSLATHLRSRLGLHGVKAGLLHERLPREALADAERLAQGIKALPLTLVAARPLDEAISSAGGVRFEALDDGLMLRARPGVFCAGEMLDWEAPTGGYLLTACFATGVAAARGLLQRLGASGSPKPG